MATFKALRKTSSSFSIFHYCDSIVNAIDARSSEVSSKMNIATAVLYSQLYFSEANEEMTTKLLYIEIKP